MHPAVVSIETSSSAAIKKCPNAPHCVDDDYSSTSILSSDFNENDNNNNDDDDVVGVVRMKNRGSNKYRDITAASSFAAASGGGDNCTKEEKAIQKLLQIDLCSRDQKCIAETLRKLSDFFSSSSHNHSSSGTGTLDHSLERHHRLVDKFEGMPIVLFVMKQNAKHSKIQSQGCRFLMKYMYHNPAGKDAICRLEGIAVLVNAMQAFKHNASVQRNAMGALVNGIWKHEENERELVEPSSSLSSSSLKKKGGISIILTAMKTFPRDTQLQLRACKLLSFLCHVEEYRFLVLQAGGFKLVGTTIKKHGAKDAEVLKYGKRVAQSLLL